MKATSSSGLTLSKKEVSTSSEDLDLGLGKMGDEEVERNGHGVLGRREKVNLEVGRIEKREEEVREREERELSAAEDAAMEGDSEMERIWVI